MCKVYRYDLNIKPASIFPLLSVLIAILVIFTGFYTPARAEDPGYALVFDGINDYINLGDTGTVMGSGSWASSKSVSLWVRVTGTTPPATEPITGEILVSTDRPRLFGVSRAVFNGQDRIWAWNSDGNGVDSVSMEFVAGEWFHVTFVHENNVLSLYKNGLLVGSTTSGITYYPTGGIDGNLFLGGSGRSDPSLYFDGQLDEVAFWDAALTEADISGVMNAVLTETHPLWSQLTAYYRMSDGAGTSLSDDSANANTGVLLGGMSDVNWVVSGAFDGDPLPTHTATATQPPVDTATPTSTSTNTLILTLTSTSTATAQNTATPTATETANLPPTATQTSSPTNTSTPTFTQTPTPTQTRTPTATLLPGPSATPTLTPAISGDTLVQIGFLDTPGNPYDIEVVNGYAYIADVNGGLRIVDVSDPAHPVELGALPWPVRAYGVAMDGNYAFIADIRAGLRIVDVSSPTAPIQVGALDTPGMSFDVAVSGDYAYVADRNGGLRIIRVDDPTSPIEVASITTPDEALSVDVAAGYAYTAIYTAGLLTSDVRTPATPVNLSVFGSSRAYGVRVIGTNAYLADGGSGLHIIDVADPAAPTLVASYNTLGWARSLRIAGNLVYIADWTAGVTVVDATNLYQPVLLTHYQTPGKVRDVDVEGPYVYVADYDYGLRILTWQ